MEADLLSAAGVMGRVCLGLVFATAALDKLRHAEVLPGVVANYRILPHGLTAPAAWLLPWVELMVGALLLAQIAQPWPALAGLALLAAFAAAMAVNLRRGRAHIDCGCHRSELKQTLRWSLVGRNLGLAALLAPGLAAPTLTTLAPTTLAPLLVGVLSGAGAFALYLLFNTLSALPALDRPAA